MANKGTSTNTNTTVRRIKATDNTPTTAASGSKTRSAKVVQTAPKATSTRRRQTGYFKGAWQELKLVRWPTRSATWSMTAAVLLFSLLFTILILVLDAGFNWTFKQLLAQ